MHRSMVIFVGSQITTGKKNSQMQVAQNQVKVATDGSFCEDTTFVQPLLKIFFSLYDYVQGI